MALPWDIPLEAINCLKPSAKPMQKTLLNHYCNINLDENPCEERQTGIMCEIKANNKDPATIQRLIAAGMTIARLDLRDLELQECSQLIQSVRQAVYNYSAELDYVYPLAVIVDIQCPDIVTGNLKGGPQTLIELFENGKVRLTTDDSWLQCGTTDCLYVPYNHLADLRPGDFVFIDTMSPEKIKLLVENVGDDSVECNIVVGGMMGSKMGVKITHVPNDLKETHAEPHNVNTATSLVSNDSAQFEDMEQQILWAIGVDIDGVLVPNTQSIQDINRVREIIADKAKNVMIFACIESALGYYNIDDIINICDGVYVDRSVLCTDLPVEKIFIAIKVIIAKCNVAGKPCICKAVINEDIPTLCVMDMANLVIDGVDVISLHLHYNSPLKKLVCNFDAVQSVVSCIAAASVVCRHAERILWQPKIYGNLELMQSQLNEPTKAICVSAVELASRSLAVVIICLTNGGKTAKLIAHARPTCPIIAVTRTCHAARSLCFWRGVRAVHYFEVAKANWSVEVDKRVHAAIDYCKAKRIMHAGDAYVVVSGSRRGVGYCDSVRLLYASARDTIPLE